MPRLPRLHVPGGCYHVILRGNHREPLFGSTADRDRLAALVAEALLAHNARVHAFCWMTNHLHVLMQISDRPLGKLVQRIAVRYAKHRHRQMRTSGHLFERRYRAWLIDADAYFITLLRYIHLNPVKAGIVQSASEYPWSSHRAYLGEESVPWVTTDFGLSFFGTSLEAARHAYARFMAQTIYASEDRILDDTPGEDPRVLGTDRFIASLPTMTIQPRSALTLDQLLEQLCRELSLDAALVRSPARRRELTPIRIRFARMALQYRIASMQEIARYLNRSASSLSELLIRHDQR
jgi:putative transposase